MPAEYIVETAQRAEQWSGDRGTFQSWNIRLMDGKGSYEATVNTKPENEFPGPGEKVQGDLIPGPKGLRFKRAYGGAGGGGNGYKRDPKESASIVRQHSQQMAISWAVILDKKGLLPERPDYPWLKGVIDWFVEDAGS